MSAFTTGHRIGPYRIIRLLGEGGMGAVYEARHEPLDRRVALKTLHPEFARNEQVVARFFNEAKVLSRLEHPSIVQASDFGQTDDGTAYLVMEYLRGESLASRLGVLLERGERLSVSIALQLGWQVADILSVAHAQDIIHRDLKPDNLMLVADPVAPSGERVKVLDFGIAKLTRSEDRGSVKTKTHTIMGTPAYMSPEQCAGTKSVDAKTDVYALGCVLYEIFAGRPPFVAEESGELIGMHLFHSPAPLQSLNPRVPSSVVELIHSLLTKDKRQRPNMSEAADELGRLLLKLTGSGPAVRSRPSADSSEHTTRAIQKVPIITTLGSSMGQLGPFLAHRKRVAFAIAAGLILILSLGLFELSRAKRSSVSVVSQGQAIVPASVPSASASTPPAQASSPLNSKPSAPLTQPLTLRAKSEPKAMPKHSDTPSSAVRKKAPKGKNFGYED